MHSANYNTNLTDTWNTESSEGNSPTSSTMTTTTATKEITRSSTMTSSINSERLSPPATDPSSFPKPQSPNRNPSTTITLKWSLNTLTKTSNSSSSRKKVTPPSGTISHHIRPCLKHQEPNSLIGWLSFTTNTKCSQKPSSQWLLLSTVTSQPNQFLSRNCSWLVLQPSSLLPNLNKPIKCPR